MHNAQEEFWPIHLYRTASDQPCFQDLWFEPLIEVIAQNIWVEVCTLAVSLLKVGFLCYKSFWSGCTSAFRTIVLLDCPNSTDSQLQPP